MLTIKDLYIEIEGISILKNINLDFEKGKNYCILGKNGSGKSSLAMTIMGHPRYEITKGAIYVDDKNITKISPHERAQMGIFLAFQHIPEIK
ncbi:ATP-binding cassette domain-containing protein [Patescibacteria group bacterium]|nr:ATP-binding cassette domain-containing protein [Patescibacteria group bacterium]MBU1758607.1 ATP-binding cassette domain-containing protein [Patescibacteria group bacterium]